MFCHEILMHLAITHAVGRCTNPWNKLGSLRETISATLRKKIAFWD